MKELRLRTRRLLHRLVVQELLLERSRLFRDTLIELLRKREELLVADLADVRVMARGLVQLALKLHDDRLEADPELNDEL